MIVIATIFASLCQGDVQPCLFEVFPGTERSQEYRLAVVTTLQLDLPDQQMRNLTRNIGPSGERRFGNVQFFSPKTKRIEFAEFGTVTDKAAFLHGLDDVPEGLTIEQETRGNQTHFHGVFKRGLFNIPFESVYQDGLYVTGMTPGVASLDLPAIKAWLATTTPDDHALRFDFGAVPETYRKQLLSEVEKRSATFLQQRDTESTDSYGIRRLLANLKLELLRSAAQDIDEMRIRVSSPGPAAGGYTIDLTVQFKDGSQLQKLCDEMRLRRSSVSLLDRDQLTGWAELHVGIPRALRQLFVNDSETLVGRLLAEAATGRFEAAVGVRADANAPHVFGASSFAGNTLPLNGLPDPQDQLNGLPRWKLDSLSGYKELAALSLLAGAGDKTLWFDLSSEPESAVERYSVEPRNTPPPLLSFQFDLSKWAGRLDERTSSRQMLRALENLCDSIYLSQRLRSREASLTMVRGKFMEGTKDLPKEVRDRQLARIIDDLTSGRLNLPDELIAPSESVLQHSDLEGDWSASGQLTARQGSLRARLSIGRELHQLYMARRLLAVKRIFLHREQNAGN